MTPQWKTQRWFQSALVGVGLVATSTLCLAATDRIIHNFDYDTAGWSSAWGAGIPEFDPGQDLTGNGGGAMRVYGDFAGDNASGNAMTVAYCTPENGNVWWNSSAICWNTADYKSIDFDIKWDNASTLTVDQFNTPPLGGETGMLMWVLDFNGAVNAGNSPKWPSLGNFQIPSAASNGWVHVSYPINPAIAGIDFSKGICFKKWIQNPQAVAGGTWSFWVDNIVLKGSTPLPPPTMSVDPNKPIPGLGFVATGGVWGRENIRTIPGSNYTFYGASGPVSYSYTVTQYPGTTYAGFQTQMYFTPGTVDDRRGDADWHYPNVISWTMSANANGGAWAGLHFKTNAPDSNGGLFDTGDLGGVGSDSPLGTWTITFENNSQITLTSPSGATMVTNIPPDVAALFNDQVEVQVGITPGDAGTNPSRLGQMATMSAVKFEGMKNVAKLDSDFVGKSLDTNVWEVLADANGVQEIPANSVVWLEWTLPATGFSLQGSPKLSGPWSTPAPAGLDLGSKHRVLLTTADVPGGNTGFWRLIKRNMSKFQVLLPGETAAPGTATGKTGTPDPLICGVVGVPFDIIVNAVDDEWNLIKTANNTVTITSTDAFFGVPADGALGLGTRTFNVYFGSAGTWTITATDTADNTKTGTSSSVSAQ